MTASGGLFAGFYPGAVGPAIATQSEPARGREVRLAARGRPSNLGCYPSLLPPPPAPPMQLAHRGDRVGHVGTLVGPVVLHAGEAQGEAARVLRARLHVVEGDFHHELGAHVHRVAIARGLELEQLTGLPRERLVCHPLERLAEHHESARVRVAGAEVEV